MQRFRKMGGFEGKERKGFNRLAREEYIVEEQQSIGKVKLERKSGAMYQEESSDHVLSIMLTHHHLPYSLHLLHDTILDQKARILKKDFLHGIVAMSYLCPLSLFQHNE